MRTRLTFSFYLLTTLAALSQPIEAWVARYHGGFTNKAHTPLAMKLDSAGNVFVAGSSQNVSNVSDYLVLKYAPDGTQLYATRYSATNGVSYTLKGFALAQDGSALLAGTGGTVKLDTNGAVAWAAPYAGNDVAVDTNGNVYVTGFSPVQYATAKLSPSGSNLWVRTYVGITGPDNPVAVSQKVAVGNSGNVCVAGWADWMGFYYPGQTNKNYYAAATAIMYDSRGNTIWTNRNLGYDGMNWGEVSGLAYDTQGNVFVSGNNSGNGCDYVAARINSSGQATWWFVYGPPGVAAMALDSSGNVYLTGGVYSGFGYGTFKLDNAGNVVWQTNYFGTSASYTYNRATGLALDNSGNVYVTGVSTNSGMANDFATIKYDPDGHKLWVQRYNGPANGNDGATAIAVAPDGSIYVTGYSANEAGGSDITTIKYVMPTTIQRKTDGSIRLRGYGLPASNYTFQAATNLLNWDAIGSSLADTNGVFQFTDTNAPSFPYRFYRWFGP